MIEFANVRAQRLFRLYKINCRARINKFHQKYKFSEICRKCFIIVLVIRLVFERNRGRYFSVCNAYKISGKGEGPIRAFPSRYQKCGRLHGANRAKSIIRRHSTRLTSIEESRAICNSRIYSATRLLCIRESRRTIQCPFLMAI